MSECPLCNGTKVLSRPRPLAAGFISVACKCTVDADFKPTLQQIGFQHSINAEINRSDFKLVKNGENESHPRPKPDLRIVENG